MGCCHSVPTVTVDVPRGVSTTDQNILREKSFVDGCKLLPFTAACPAAYPYEWQHVVEAGPGYCFAASFEGVNGAAAARHCRERAHHELAAALRAGMGPERALRAMWKELDTSFLGGAAPEAIRASTGATGCAVYIDTREGVAYASRLGAPGPFLARSKGAFSMLRVEVLPLATSTPHSATYAELVRRQEAATHEAQTQRPQRGLDQQPQEHEHEQQASAPSQRQQQQQAPLDQERWHAYALPDELQPGSAGRPLPTHCVGCGYGKNARLQAVWLKERRAARGAAAVPDSLPRVPFLSAECEVAVERLRPTDEMLVLASRALGELVSPQEAALMAHTFGATKLAAMRDAYATSQQATPSAAALPRGARPSGPRLREGNVASAVVQRAVLKALASHNRAYRARLDHAGLKSLPLSVNLATLPPPAAGMGPGPAKLALPSWYPAAGVTRGDVLGGDLGVLLLHMDWPGAREAVPRSPAVARAGPSAPCSPSPARGARRAPNPAAQHRWELVRLLVKFQSARRRQLLEAWWAAADGAVRRAEEAARVAEVAAWRALGQAVQVTRCGEVFDAPDTPPKLPQPRSPVRPASAQRGSAAAAKLRTARPDASSPRAAGLPPAAFAGAAASPKRMALDSGRGGGSPSPHWARQQAQMPTGAWAGRAAASPSPSPSLAGTGAGGGGGAAAKISLRRRDAGSTAGSVRG